MDLLSEHEIEEYVINIVRSCVREYATTIIPSVDEIVKGLGLCVKNGELPLDKDGVLIGEMIIINTQVQNEERKQFTRFHEITHYLIKQDGYLISILHDALWRDKIRYENILEKICNIGAAEFLMPGEEFRRLYKEGGFCVGLIVEASQHFGSSKIATTIQMAQVAPHSCITAVCEYGSLPRGMENQDCLFTKDNLPLEQWLHVVYSASSPSMKYHLAKYTIIPDEHPIYSAFCQGKLIMEESYIPFNSGKKMPCYCEALLHSDRIYTIFHIESPPDNKQLEFRI